MQDVRFAIVGCGKIGPRHAEKLQKVKGAVLAAVCDIVPERADAIAEKYGVKTYYNVEDVLKDKSIDFINMCTPSGLHPSHTIQALNAGKNVLCEKPMAFREADARAMVEAAEKNKKFLFVVKQNRYNPPVKLVSKLLKEGKLGKPIACVVNMFWNRNEDYYKNDRWRGTLAMDGGTLYTQASHFADLMLVFMGKPKSVFALMGTHKQPVEIEDTGVVAVEFSSGACGSFNYTTCATNKNFEGSITIFGTKGTIKIGGEYLNTIDYFQVEGVDSYEMEESDAGPNDYGTYKGSMSNHDKVFEAILARMGGGEIDDGLVSGTEAVGVVRFMEKAMESAKKGERIYFP